MMKVLVIGAGVIGLTTAITLQEAGHEVIIWADRHASETTSSKAAALWEPFQPQIAAGRASAEALTHQRDVLAWGAHAYKTFLSELGGERGVKRVRVFEIKRNDDPPWWSSGKLGDDLRLSAVPTPAALRDAGPYAAYSYAFDSIVIDMSRYLAYLEARFTAGQSEPRIISSHLTDLAAITGFDVVVNCAGLGARDLAGDGALTGVRGQIIVVEQFGLTEWLLDQNDPDRLTYLVPRENTVILGGTAEEGDEDLEVRPATAAAILRRCSALAPEAAAARIVAHRVGLRPARPTVRLETEISPDGPVIHCYGHGGAGVTLSYGCAGEVVEQVSRLGDP